MTIEERKERFFKFDGCFGKACVECSYGNRTEPPADCREAIHEDAKLIMKHSAGEKAINEITRPTKYETPLTMKEREQIKELIRAKTEVPDMSAHFIQEINELCASLNSLASLVSKLEQLRKGTDPIGYVDDVEREKTELIACIGTEIDIVSREAADVYNYLWALGQEDRFFRFRHYCDQKLARWANRLNGVSDE